MNWSYEDENKNYPSLNDINGKHIQNMINYILSKIYINIYI